MDKGCEHIIHKRNTDVNKHMGNCSAWIVITGAQFKLRDRFQHQTNEVILKKSKNKHTCLLRLIIHSPLPRGTHAKNNLWFDSFHWNCLHWGHSGPLITKPCGLLLNLPHLVFLFQLILPSPEAPSRTFSPSLASLSSDSPKTCLNNTSACPKLHFLLTPVPVPRCFPPPSRLKYCAYAKEALICPRALVLLSYHLLNTSSWCSERPKLNMLQS